MVQSQHGHVGIGGWPISSLQLETKLWYRDMPALFIWIPFELDISTLWVSPQLAIRAAPKNAANSFNKQNPSRHMYQSCSEKGNTSLAISLTVGATAQKHFLIYTFTEEICIDTSPHYATQLHTVVQMKNTL